MLTRSQLFAVRLKQHFLRYYRALQSICDWSVWLYILIPAAVLFIGFYREWWADRPQWAVHVPWDILSLIIITVIICLSRITILVEDADQVVLLQKPQWLLSIKRWGLLYSWFFLQLKIVCVLLLLLPFLVLVNEWNTGHIVMLLAHTAISSVITLIVNHRWIITAPWWKNIPIEALILLVNGVVIFVPMFLYLELIISYWVGMIILLIVALMMISKYTITPLNFQQHLSSQNEAKLKFTKLLLSQSIELTSTSKRKRPILFKKSQRLSKRNDVESLIGDLYIKSLLRDFGMLKVWLMFLSVSCFALSQVPGYAPFAVIILLSFIVFNLFNFQWGQWCKHDFISQYMKAVEYPIRARRRARTPFIAFFVLIWLIVATCMQI